VATSLSSLSLPSLSSSSSLSMKKLGYCATQSLQAVKSAAFWDSQRQESSWLSSRSLGDGGSDLHGGREG
jgi:hypothetical protein